MFGLDPITMFLISTALTVGSSILQYQQAQKQSSSQLAAIQQASQNQTDQQKKITSIVTEEAKKYDPAARMAEQANIESGMNQGFDAALGRAKEIGYGAVNPSLQGAVSDEYLKDTAEATTKAGFDATELARLMAKIGAGTQLRQNEAIRFGETSNRIGMQQNFARGQLGADDLTIKTAGMPNASAQLVAGILGGLGQAGMMSSLPTMNSSGSTPWSNLFPAPVSTSQPMFFGGR